MSQVYTAVTAYILREDGAPNQCQSQCNHANPHMLKLQRLLVVLKACAMLLCCFILLLCCYGAGGPVRGSALFNDPLFSRSNTWDLSTSNVTQPFLSSFGFGPVTAAGYGIGYMVHVSFRSALYAQLRGTLLEVPQHTCARIEVPSDKAPTRILDDNG